MLYCLECDKTVEDVMKIEKETYNVLGKHKITIDAKVHYCPHCHNQLFDFVDDEENIEKAYAIYLEKYGLMPRDFVKKVKTEE